MANVRPVSCVDTSPSPPPNALRINYRHNGWPKDRPWLSIDLQKWQMTPPDMIPSLLHNAFNRVSISKTRILSLDDEQDLARPGREVGMTELDRIVRAESVLVDGVKNKLDVTIHDEVRQPVRVAEMERQAAAAAAATAGQHETQRKREKSGGLCGSCQLS